jgi:hypothetical protein
MLITIRPRILTDDDDEERAIFLLMIGVQFCQARAHHRILS